MRASLRVMARPSPGRLSSPEILEPIGGQLGIGRVLDVLVPEPIVLVTYVRWPLEVAAVE
jgi:hypothetical protein